MYTVHNILSHNIYLSICLPSYLLCLSIHLSGQRLRLVALSVYKSVSLSVRLSTCLFVY